MKLIWATCAGLAVAIIVIPAFFMAGGVLVLCYATVLLLQDDWLN